MFSKWFKRAAPSASDPIQEADECLKRNPRDVLALQNRAEAFLKRHDAAAALRDTERALQIALLEPRLKGQVRSALLASLYTLKSRALMGVGDREQAQAAVEQALAERPDYAGALLQSGRLMRDMGDWDGALQQLDQAIRLDDKEANAYLARGMTWKLVGDADRAYADYTRAIELDKTLAMAWSKRAQVCHARGDLNRAVNECKAALNLDPYLVEPYAELAWVARQQGNLSHSFQIIQQGLKQHPGEPLLLVQMAHSLVDQNQLSEALAAVNRALDKSADYASALALRGQIHGRMGNLASALEDLGRAVEIDPGTDDAWFNYALAHAHAGNMIEALAAISRVLQLVPNDQEASAWRAQLARQLGLELLDQAARILEQFAYSHCGPGRIWKVEPRRMHSFRPDGSAESYNAAMLDLGQKPQAVIVVRVEQAGYHVEVLAELLIPEAPRTPLGQAFVDDIPIQPGALLNLLNGLFARGMLVQSGHSLRWVGN
ncbi:MAG: tetratricopeptide repeat protein [Anaerolineae bacterium]|nr:tetratricopeptide repeat protein [Anaerolineae bacterium]